MLILVSGPSVYILRVHPFKIKKNIVLPLEVNWPYRPSGPKNGSTPDRFELRAL